MAVTAGLAGMTVAAIRAKARSDAAEVLARHWGGALPVDPIQIARELGVSVFSAQLGEDTWGMLIGSPTGVDMYLDRDQPQSRLRFSCAHELGHFVDRGETLEHDRAFIDKRSNDDRGRADEVYANEFAASVLMPEREFRTAVAADLSPFDLADRFNVSLDAVQWRRKHLRT